MEEQVVYVQASESNPNTSEIDEICRNMAADGLTLLQVSPSQGAGGVTVGLWLFFSRQEELGIATDGVRGETRWSTPGWTASRVPVNAALQTEPPQTPIYWLRELREKKGLGLSLTLTGVTSVFIGVVLHFALQHNVIETTFRAGYFFGMVGILLFLIGLLIVF